MSPALALSVANGALGLLEAIAPVIIDGVRTGQNSIEQQAALDARVFALRPGGKAFAGPEWEYTSPLQPPG